VDDDAYRVEVAFRAFDAGDVYEVSVTGAGRCTTPCTLRGFPGRWDLAVSGAAEFTRSVFVPAVGADVVLARQNKGDPTLAGIGEAVGGIMVVGGAVSAVVGGVWATATPNDRSEAAAQLSLLIGGIVVGLAGLPVFFAARNQWGDKGFDDAVVVPRGSAQTHAVRFVGVGARESAMRTLIPVVTFAFE
jgi:hypothetical protein